MFRFLSVVTIAASLWVSPAVCQTDAVAAWNTIMLNTSSAQNPFAKARFAAIVSLSVFEAVNSCTHQFRPYLGTVACPSDASPDAAAAVAAHDTLKFYFPGAAPSLDAALANSLALIPDGAGKDHGSAVGQAAAAAMIALRSADGATPPTTFVPSSTAPGSYQLTPPLFAPAILYNWRDVTPFGIKDSKQFRSLPPPDLTSSKYTKSYLEVMPVGDVDSTARPQDRSDVALYYNVAGAVDVWDQVVMEIAQHQGTSLTVEARALALVNMAVSDGLVSSMESKYFYLRWRPVTAIRAGDTDYNPDTPANPTFTPFIVTPRFPSYPSAHASASYAARTIVKRIFGGGTQSITLSNAGIPSIVLHYTKLKDITDDIDDARVYGGIHFRYDQEAGARMGLGIGSYVYNHNLQSLGDVPAPDQECSDPEDCSQAVVSW